MTLIRKERFGLDVPEIWRRMFENDLQGGWLRVEEFVDGDDLVIRSEIPGVDPERDVELTIDDGVLRISARREERSEQKDKNGFRSEFRYGTFVRNVVLPPGVNEDDIKASYKDGILEIRISGGGADKREAKKIAVTKE
ncbi:MAG: Hsp20/alpha crystallin family protein [Polyangiales bacterium]